MSPLDRMREVTMIEEDRWTEVPGLSVTVTTKKSHEKVLLVPRHEEHSKQSTVKDIERR